LALPDSPPSLALDAVVQSLIVANVGELVGELAEMCCPDCGIKFMEFRAGGRLGCPQDYWVFSKGLLPLLLRYHGTTRHIGKMARRREGAMDRLRLRTLLREAIAREEYEEAARLRDLLRTRDPHA
jgi:protein arginine kinase activator